MRQTFGKSHHGALASGKQLAAIACHALFRLIPPQLNDGTFSTGFHALANKPGKTNRSEDVDAPEPLEFARKGISRSLARQHVGTGIVDPNVDCVFPAP